MQPPKKASIFKRFLIMWHLYSLKIYTRETITTTTTNNNKDFILRGQLFDTSISVKPYIVWSYVSQFEHIVNVIIVYSFVIIRFRSSLKS